MSWQTEQKIYSDLAVQNEKKIVFLVLDGVGDIQGKKGKTPLELAKTPILDRLAAEGCSGLFDPVAPGITPGSGPGHLGLFGYDPLDVVVGRGVLAALGIGFPLQPDDVAARFNYCSLDTAGRVSDRRAGRISTEENERLTGLLLEQLNLDDEGVEIHLRTVSEHRGLLVLRGAGLGAKINDTDPQQVGLSALRATGADPKSERAAGIVNKLVAQVTSILEGEDRAHGVLLRGFDSRPDIDTLPQRFGLKPLCVAQYPMYRGLARLVGMELAPPPENLESLPETLAEGWEDFDFFFCHVKYTDKAGEDGNFDWKTEVIEGVDHWIPKVLDLKPDVLVVSADHSTPAGLAAHSWHSVPSLIWAPTTVRKDGVQRFDEIVSANGGLGQQRLRYLLPLALAHAGKLKKFGA